MKKRIWSFLLCLTLLMSMMPLGLMVTVSAYSEEETYCYWSGENNGERHSAKPASGGYAYYDRETNMLEIKDFTYDYDYPEDKSFVMFGISCDGLVINLIGNSTVNITGKRAIVFVSCLGRCEITSAKEASLSVTATGDTDIWTHCFYCKNRINFSSNEFFDPELIISGKATVSLSAVSVNTDEDFRHAVAVDADPITVKDSAKVFLYGSYMAAMKFGGMCAGVSVEVGYDPLVKCGHTADDSKEEIPYGNKVWTWDQYISVTPAPPKPPEPIAISSVTVRLFESPVGGATAGSKSNLYIPSGEHYSFDPAQRNGGYSFWRNSDSVSLRDSATFSSGSSYSECAHLVADKGYYFADDCKFYAYDTHGDAVPLSKSDTRVSESDNTRAYIYAAAEEASPAAYKVSVNGKSITPSNKDNVLGDAGTPTVTYSPRSNTLTLNGYDGSYIKATIPLNIVLADGSQNRITVPAETEECGIYCEGDLTISGGGDLSVETKPQYCEAICNLDGDISIDMSGDLNVKSAMKGILSADGDILLAGGGNYTVNAGTDGIDTEEEGSDIRFLNEGAISVTAGRYAVTMIDGMLILDGTGTPITLTSGDDHPAVHQSNENEYLVISSDLHMRYVAVEGAPEESYVVYNFVQEEELIHSATICGISSPVAGGTPRTQPALYVPDGEHFSVVSSEGMSSEWMGRDDSVMAPDDVFALNGEYAQIFYLISDAGYRFASDCTFTLIGTDGQNKAALVASTLPDEPYYAMIATAFVKSVPDAETHLYGDVNGDGKVDSTDARLILQYYAKKIGESDLNTAVADVNADGKVDSTDARLILQLYAKKITEFPKA